MEMTVQNECLVGRGGVRSSQLCGGPRSYSMNCQSGVGPASHGTCQSRDLASREVQLIQLKEK